MQCLLAHPTFKKETITAAQLEQLLNSKALSMDSQYDICCFNFPAGLWSLSQIDELAKLVRSDVELDSEKLQLFIESRKTDKYRDSGWVVLAVSRKVTSPVNMIKQYLDKAQLSHDSPLFCQLSTTK